MIKDPLPIILLPLKECVMVLPNTSVAEVIAAVEVIQAKNSPLWHLGFIQWRGLRLHLIAFENLTGLYPGAMKLKSQIAILNRISPAGKIDFIALVLNGLPRLFRVNADDLTIVSERRDDLIQMNILLKGERCVIPNLELLFQSCEALSEI